jgi:hypothetical protein
MLKRILLASSFSLATVCLGSAADFTLDDPLFSSAKQESQTQSLKGFVSNIYDSGVTFLHAVAEALSPEFLAQHREIVINLLRLIAPPWSLAQLLCSGVLPFTLRDIDERRIHGTLTSAIADAEAGEYDDEYGQEANSTESTNFQALLQKIQEMKYGDVAIKTLKQTCAAAASFGILHAIFPSFIAYYVVFGALFGYNVVQDLKNMTSLPLFSSPADVFPTDGDLMTWSVTDLSKEEAIDPGASKDVP